MVELAQSTIPRSGGSNQASSQPKFPSPVSTLQRHLIDCKVTVFTRGDNPNLKPEFERVKSELEGKCKELAIVDCYSYKITDTSFIPTTVESAKDSTIAIFLFYQYREKLAEELVHELRKANPEIRIVFISWNKRDIPPGTADLTLTKAELLSMNGSLGFCGSLSALLTETPIAEKIHEFTYNGKNYFELSPAAQRAIRSGAVIEKELMVNQGKGTYT